MHNIDILTFTFTFTFAEGAAAHHPAALTMCVCVPCVCVWYTICRPGVLSVRRVDACCRGACSHRSGSCSAMSLASCSSAQRAAASPSSPK